MSAGDVLSSARKWSVCQADNLDWLKALPDGCCSLTMFSPPYESARTYGVDFALQGQAWVDWLAVRVVQMCRVTAGLVVCNAAGQVRNHSYSPVVEWLVADLTRKYGIVVGPAPYVYFRFGIPGSGGERYHRRDHEPVYCFARPDRLPLAWSDNTAEGHPPKWAPGGEMSNRLKDGQRVSKWGSPGGTSRGAGTKPDGTRKPLGADMTGEVYHDPTPGLFGPVEEAAKGPPKCGMSRRPNGRSGEGVEPGRLERNAPPVLANPGNVVREKYDAETVRQLLDALVSREIDQGDVIRCLAGGGMMGSKLAHDNEAPFPERLVEFFVNSYCPPGGIVCDPFAGSGTVGAVAVRLGRRFVGCDLRESQVTLARRRIGGETPDLFSEAPNGDERANA